MVSSAVSIGLFGLAWYITLPMMNAFIIGWGNKVIRVKLGHSTIQVEECTTPTMVLLFEAPIIVSNIDNAKFFF